MTPEAKQMSAAKHSPTLPKLRVDKDQPGVIRIEGTDAMTGILAGMRAPEIVRRCNSHDALVAALEEQAEFLASLHATYRHDSRLAARISAHLTSARAALKAAKGEA